MITDVFSVEDTGKDLYLPGAILKDENEIIIFEIEKYKTAEIVIGDTPMLS